MAGVWNLNDSASFGLNVRNPNYMKGIAVRQEMVDAKVHRPRLADAQEGGVPRPLEAGQVRHDARELRRPVHRGQLHGLRQELPQRPVGRPAAAHRTRWQERQRRGGRKDARIYAISKKAMDAGKGPAIAKLLEWMASDGYMLLGFGQEGVNYKLDKDGNITTEGIDPKLAWTAKEKQPLTQLRNMVYVNKPIELKARYPSYKTAERSHPGPAGLPERLRQAALPGVDGRGHRQPADQRRRLRALLQREHRQVRARAAETGRRGLGDYVAGLDKLGAKDLEAAAKKTLTQAGFLK